MPLAFYAAFFGALISTAGVCYLALRGHDPLNPLTVSQVVSQKRRDLNLFRVTIWLGGTLVAITVFFFIVPRIKYDFLVAASFALVYVCELLLSIFPDNHLKKSIVHYIFAYSMGIGMLAAALLFYLSLGDSWAAGGMAIFIGMLVAILLTFVDSKRFMFYEMAFIGMSHISVLIAAIALR